MVWYFLRHPESKNDVAHGIATFHGRTEEARGEARGAGFGV